MNAGVYLLKFPKDSEKAFRHYSYRHSINQIRLAFFLGVFFYGSVAFIDPYVVPTIAQKVFVLRFAFVVPLLLVSLVISYFTKNEIFIQWLGTLNMLVSGTSAVLMMLWDPGVGGYIYIGGVLLIILYAYIFLRLRFFYATLSGWGLCLIYVVMALFFKKGSFSVFVSNSFFCLIANTIGMSASYTFEVNMREQYLNAMGMKRVHRELQRLSNLDPLTKIANRRFFDTRLQVFFDRARLTGSPISTIVIDVDFFKSYNDSLGHQSGDDCLVRIADRVNRHAKRAGDLTARYGGEEFAVILVDTASDAAVRIAEEIREDVRAIAIPHPCSPIAPVVTISLGVATLTPGEHDTPEKLIRAGDLALYESKAKGRNRVSVSFGFPPDASGK